MFNNKYGLTKSVIKGCKTVTRRFMVQPPFEGCDLAWLLDSTCKEDSKHEKQCKWLFKGQEVSDFFKPNYEVGEIVAIAQQYRDIIDFLPNGYKRVSDGYISSIITTSAGYDNKMFVRADLMPYRIKITDVRAERLCDISDEDCLLEGIDTYTKDGTVKKYSWIESKIPWADMPRSPREAFAILIDKLNRKGTFELNLWVWRYEFEIIEGGQS